MARILCCASLLFGLSQASPERQAAREWAEASFFGEAPKAAAAKPGLEVRRQDHGTFLLNQSVMKTPLKIGEVSYARGLGTHSVSEVVVRLPGPGRRFEAAAGIDNNYDTKGKLGSAVFAVEAGGKELYKSGVHRGGMAPLAVSVDLAGAAEFTLRVLDGGDGPGWDQSDWADAKATLADGSTVWLDKLPVVEPGEASTREIPFSFTFGGRPSAELLAAWKKEAAAPRAERGGTLRALSWTDPERGLRVSCEVLEWDDAPAVEWVVRFRNGGSADAPVLEDVQALHAAFIRPKEGEFTLHRLNGSTCTENDFLPVEEPLPPNHRSALAPNGGRSSDGTLPFFNLAWPGGGVAAAIGWSGQWAASFQRDGGRLARVRAGMQTTRIALRPGEEIRTPRMLLVFWKGDDRLRGNNLLRRVILDRYVPRDAGGPIIPPVTVNTWFAFNEGNTVTEANQLDCLRRVAPLGIDAFWIDAGWFIGGWPSGVGNWSPRPDAFPRGLKPVGDAAREAGLGFVVWFEPERVSPGSRIHKEHPEWVMRTGGGDGLFNLGIPEARAWLTDHLSKIIAESGITVYRNDFNIAPLPFWQKADGPDRKGLSEIRYIEGLYAMWEELRRRHPGLTIDDCASGGRRIDLEMLRLSYPLWRSDTPCDARAHTTWDQNQIAGLTQYVPLHGTGPWGFDRYTWRSAVATGASIGSDPRSKDFPAEEAKRCITETKRLRPFWLGDFYPLTPIEKGETSWCGWQLHRADRDAGMIELFRRGRSPYAAIDLAVRGLDPKGTYLVTHEDEGRSAEMKGEALSRLRVSIESAPGTVLITYFRKP